MPCGSACRSIGFQCSSASRKFLNRRRRTCRSVRVLFQCSSASRKFLNHAEHTDECTYSVVSVLFSEPKIPQFIDIRKRVGNDNVFQCSSASRKFLNATQENLAALRQAFQCSSASRKFLNSRRNMRPGVADSCFSALQRAENSSIDRNQGCAERDDAFQCSSASRKFLNPDPRTCVHPYFRPR